MRILRRHWRFVLLALCGNIVLLLVVLYVQLTGLFMSGHFDRQRGGQVRAFAMPDGQTLREHVDRRLAVHGTPPPTRWSTNAFAGYSLVAACRQSQESWLCLEFRLNHDNGEVTANNRLTAAVLPELRTTDRPSWVADTSDSRMLRRLRRREADVGLTTPMAR